MRQFSVETAGQQIGLQKPPQTTLLNKRTAPFSALVHRFTRQCCQEVLTKLCSVSDNPATHNGRYPTIYFVREREREGERGWKGIGELQV